MVDNRVEVLFDRIGRARVLSFGLEDHRDRDWLAIAVEDISLEDFSYRR